MGLASLSTVFMKSLHYCLAVSSPVLIFLQSGGVICARVLSGTNIFYMREWLYLLIVGGLRSYFVIGLYNSFAVRQIRLLHAEQEKRMEQMLSVNSGLYGEVFYLKKAMNTIEGITANSYELYRDLRSGHE